MEKENNTLGTEKYENIKILYLNKLSQTGNDAYYKIQLNC